MKLMSCLHSDTRRRVTLVALCMLPTAMRGFAAEPFEPTVKVDNAIVPKGNIPELIYTRQAKLNSGLTEGPAVAADGSIYFTDMPFGAHNGMNQKGLFDDWKGIPSNVDFGIGDDAHSLYITIDKSLYRLKVKTRGFHPHLESK